MASMIQTNFRVRHSFGKIQQIITIPNLIDIQKRSYEKFLQANIPQHEREDIGLQGVFRSVFPIRDFNGTSELVFVGYTLERPKYDVDECVQRGMTFAAPIKVTIQLIIYDSAGEGSERTVRDIKEQEVYFGEIPLMTENGTFIINGTERVVVSQLHRSPGVFFDHDKGKTHSSGKLLYQARVIPYRGSWLDFEFDPKDIIYVRIDRRRKLHATVLLKALGYTPEDLLRYYYDTETVFLEKGGKYSKSIEFEILPGQRATRDIKVGDEVIVKQEPQVHARCDPQAQGRWHGAPAARHQELVGKVSAETSSTRRRARSSSRPTRRSRRRSSRSSAKRRSRASRSSSSTASTSAATSATRCSQTRSRRRTRRSSRSTVASARAIRRRSRRRARCSRTCSSTRSATTSARSAASS
jgi:DNA-directed RNA polymerase subunit beta